MISKNRWGNQARGIATIGGCRSLPLAQLVLLCVAGTAGATTAAPAAAFDAPSPLEGVWRVTRHGVDCRTGQVMSTFMAITTFARGETLTGFGVPPGSAPAQGSPEYGVWRHLGGPNYVFRILSYGYDSGGAFNGSGEVTGQLELAHDGDHFSYTSKIAFFDTAGNPQFSVCGAATGLRFGQP